MDKKKVTFLFGAGAEGAGQIGLPSGASFKRNVILANGAANLGNKYLHSITLKNGTIISHNSNGILYQTIVEKMNTDESVLSNLFLEEKDREVAKQYCEYKLISDTEKRKEIDSKADEFQKLYYAFYKSIKNSEQNELNEQVKYFLDNAGIYSFLDSYFNYLRKPERYKKECARVIKVYYAAFKCIIDSLKDCLGNSISTELQELYEEIFDEIDISDDVHQKLEVLINGLQASVVEKASLMTDEEKNKCYYFNIKKRKNDLLDVSFITTNYTDLAERIIGGEDSQVAYLHGKLSLFEDVSTKQIASVSTFNKSNDIFPYLLVQSGVKPIISPVQINEYAKAMKLLDESDEVVIVGYGVNSDDEHISSFLRERLMNKKNITCFIHCDKKDKSDFEEKKTYVQSQLGITEHLKFYDTDDFDQVLNNICAKG